jgi:hypothetical protein
MQFLDRRGTGNETDSQAGLSQRMQIRGGSFFDTAPEGAYAYVVKMKTSARPGPTRSR